MARAIARKGTPSSARRTAMSGMTPAGSRDWASHPAWCMREFLGTGLADGKTQSQIAREVGRVQISGVLMTFYAQFGWWSNEFSWEWDYNKRRYHYFRQALDNYIFSGHEIVQP